MYYKNLDDFKNQCGYDINGRWYPRVTAILSIKAKPALYKFYADHKDFESAETMKARSAEEGTLIHETLEGLLTDPSHPIPPSVQPIAVAFQEFSKKHTVRPLQIESQIISRKNNYAGTIDVLAEVDGIIGVLDIKTSKAIYRDYGIQTAAYVAALHEDPLMPLLTRWILRADQTRPCLEGCGSNMRDKGGVAVMKESKNGGAICKHVWGESVGEIELKQLKDFDKDFNAFMAAKALWEWEHDYWLSKLLTNI